MSMQIKPPATFLDENGNPANDFKVYISSPNTDPTDPTKHLAITDAASGEVVSNPFVVSIDGYTRNTLGAIISPTVQQQEYAIRFESSVGVEGYTYPHIKGDAFGLTGSEQGLVDLVFNNFPQAQAANLTDSNLIMIQSITAGWEGTPGGPDYTYLAYYTGGVGAPGTGVFSHFFDSVGNEWKITSASVSSSFNFATVFEMLSNTVVSVVGFTAETEAMLTPATGVAGIGGAKWFVSAVGQTPTSPSIAVIPNTGVIVDAAGNEYTLSENQDVNVFMFGAIGNGVNDDSAALNAALSSAYSPMYGDASKVFSIESGLSYLTSGQVLDLNGATVIRRTGSGVYPILTASTSVSPLAEVYIEGVKINGNKDADSLVATNPADRFPGLTIIDAGKVIISDIKAEGTVNNETFAGVYLEGCHDYRTFNIDTPNNDRTGFIARNCTGQSKGHTGDNCIGSGVAWTGALLSGPSLIEDVYVDGSGYSSITINIKDSIARNLHAKNSPLGYGGINLGHDSEASLADGTTLEGFTINDALGWGLTTSGATDLFIGNGQIKNSAEIGLRIFNNSVSCSIDNVTVKDGATTNIQVELASCTLTNVTSTGSAARGLSGVSATIAADSTCVFDDNDRGAAFTDGSSVFSATSSNNTQEGLLMDNGRHRVLGATLIGNGTPLAEVNTPLVDIRNTILDAADLLTGNINAVIGTTSITVLNKNVARAAQVRVTPANSTAQAKGVPSVPTIVPFVSFTVDFGSTADGTEVYRYSID